MKLKITAIITAAVLLIFTSLTAHAAVYTVEKPTNGNTIYIAGDPDMYPIEYYDTQDKEYKGILPELYKKISDDSGIDFSYIDSGIVNDQYRLAKNDQVEIVSAHAKGDVDYLSDEVHILTYKKGDEQIELCVGFTSIAPMYTSHGIPKSAATVAVATPCIPAPVSAMSRRLPMRRASSACPMVLFTLCAPVWLRSSRFRRIFAPPRCSESRFAYVMGDSRPT